MSSHALELYSWVKFYKRLHLTIKDLKRFEIGKEYDVVVFDRNYDDIIWNHFDDQELRAHRPEELFQYNHHKIVYLGNLRWKMVTSFGTFEHPVHFDTSFLPTNYTWYPVEDEYLTINDEMISVGEQVDPSRGPIRMRWNWFRDDTRIGWRGPMMFWKDLKDTEDVYWISPLRLEPDISGLVTEEYPVKIGEIVELDDNRE